MQKSQISDFNKDLETSQINNTNLNIDEENNNVPNISSNKSQVQ